MPDWIQIVLDDFCLVDRCGASAGILSLDDDVGIRLSKEVLLHEIDSTHL